MPPFQPTRPLPLGDMNARIPMGPRLGGGPPVPPPRPPMRPAGPAAGKPQLGAADFAALKQLRDDILAARPGPDGSMTIRIPPQHAQAIRTFMTHLNRAAGPGGSPVAGRPPGVPPGPLGGPPPRPPGVGPSVLAGMLPGGGPPGGGGPPALPPPDAGDKDEGGEG